MILRKLMGATAALLWLAPALGAQAAPADPAARRVESLCNGVLQAVKQAGKSTLQVRARRLQPVIEEDFDLGAMAQFAIGPAWGRMTAAERASLVAVLTRYTAARYAQAFDTYDGQRCVVDPAVITRGPDKLVKSRIVEPDETSSVNYRLREAGGAWKVIDVYYEGVSELATERADFAGVLQARGPKGLIARLQELTAKMR